MEWDLIERVLNEGITIGVKSVKLNWRGESTLSPYFIKAVKLATSLGFVETMLNTNASYTSGKVSESVMLIDKVIVSVESLDSSTAKLIRPGTELNIVLSNLERLALSRKLYKSPKSVILNCTVQKANSHEVNDIAQYCKELGIELHTKAVFPRNPPKADQYYDDTKLRVIGRKNCGFPFQRLTVSWDGKVAPCCVPWTNDLFVGDMETQSLIDIWNSGAIRYIRRDAKEASYKHNTCINCTSWSSYETEIVS